MSRHTGNTRETATGDLLNGFLAPVREWFRLALGEPTAAQRQGWPERGLGSRHKLTVEEWNGRPVTATQGAELLAAAGFVRDYVGMTFYPGVE